MQDNKVITEKVGVRSSVKNKNDNKIILGIRNSIRRSISKIIINIYHFYELHS